MSGGNEQLILQLLQEVRDAQKVFADRFDVHEARASSFDVRLQKHAEDSAAFHKEIIGAFPAEDVEGHRRYHESVIEWRELRNKIIRECLVKVSATMGFASLCWLLYAIWTAFKLEVSR